MDGNNYCYKTALCNFTEATLDSCSLPTADVIDNHRYCVLSSLQGMVVECCSKHAQRNHCYDAVSQFCLDMPFESLSFLYLRMAGSFSLYGRQKNLLYLQKLESTKGGRKVCYTLAVVECT